jgi:hypothetical protein
MKHHKIAKAIPMGSTAHFTMYSSHVQDVMQETLRTLGDIDFQYELDFEKLEHSDTGPEIKQHIARQLKERHLERREPYIRLLAELQARVTCGAFASPGIRFTGAGDLR